MQQARSKPSQFLEMEPKIEKFKKGFHTKYKEAQKRIENWEPVFNELIPKFCRCQSLFYGSESIQKMINTKVELFNPIGKDVVDELLSYLKINPRSITVDIPEYTVFKDIINDIIGSAMYKGDIYNGLIKAFKDYIIYGISLTKINSDSNNVMNVENVDITSCVWDTNTCYKTFRPSFFIREYIKSNFDTSNMYGAEFVSIRKDKDIDFNRINLSSRSILEMVKNIALSDKQIKVDYNDDIFSDAASKISKKKVDDGLSQIIEYNCLENIKIENKAYKCYTKYVFVNGSLAEYQTNIPLRAFPYISMAKYRHDSALISDMFDSKIHDAMSEIIQFNIIENSKCDAILSSANGTLIVNSSAMLEKDRTLKNIKSNVIEIDSSADVNLAGLVMNVPPATVDQSMIIQSNTLLSRLRQKFGLLNFDPNMPQAKSGYHEALRLDRESQSISNIVTPLDYALNNIGHIIIFFIKEYSRKDVTTLLKLTKNIDAKEILSNLADISEEIHVDVSESRESQNNSMKVFNQLKGMADIMGTPLQVPPAVIAQALNVSDNVLEIFEQYNSSGENKLENAEIQEKMASAADKMASAQKKIAESRAL